MRYGLALIVGFVASFALVQLPALATSQSIDAVDRTAWNPADVTIDVGDSVTWTNTTAYMHNVCIRRSNVASGCDEWRSGDPVPSDQWTGGKAHQFTSDGTFTYACQLHSTMRGTITVGTGANPPVGTGTGTGTSTTPPIESQPTDTTTVPQTQQTTLPSSDTTKPAFTGAVKRRSSRKALILQLGSSEEATLKLTVYRRAPRGRKFAKQGASSLHVHQGENVVTVPRKAGGRLRSGAYRVMLQLADAAGNKSAPKTLSFKLA